MKQSRRFLALASATVFFSALSLVLANELARAQQDGAAQSDSSAAQQDQNSNDWTFSQPQTAAQPDKAQPIDVAGCWSGTIDDDETGPGTGHLLFVQKNRKLLHSTTGGLDFSDGATASGKLSGRVSGASFVLNHHNNTCRITFRGSSVDGDLVGTYIVRRCSKITTGGTFNFSFDSSNSSCQ